MGIGWNDVGRLLADVAPTIAAGLVSLVPGGGFLSPVVAMGVREIEKALGIGSAAGAEPATPEQVAEALSAGSPETLLKLREADNAYKTKCLEAGIDLEKIAAADRDSARKREIATGDWVVKALATIIVSGYIGVQWFLLTHVVDQSMRDLVMRSLGVLDTSLGLVLAYYFGTSSGSKVKTDALTAIAKGK